MSRPKKYQTEEELRVAQRASHREWLQSSTHICPCGRSAARRYCGDWACEQCVAIEQENEKRNSAAERTSGTRGGDKSTIKYGSETYRLALRGIGT